MYLVVDIETDFEWSRIDMIGVHEPCTGFSGTYRSVEGFLGYLSAFKELPTIVTWNGTRFDIPLLQRLWDVDLSMYEQLDGMLLHKLMFHGVKGGHSLDAVAKSYFPSDPTKWKSEIDFAEATMAELEAYCKKDCEVTWEVVKHMLLDPLFKENKDSWKTALKLEQKVAALVDEQVQHEVRFDVSLATRTYMEICIEMKELEEDAVLWLPTIPLTKSEIDYPPKVQFKKDGTPSAALLRYVDRHDRCISTDSDGKQVVKFKFPTGGDEWLRLPLKEPITSYKKLTLKNQAALKDWLLSEGWSPTDWNYKFVEGKKVLTSPRLTDKITKEPCPNLIRMGFYKASDISRWLMLRSRKNILLSDKGTGWIAKAKGSPTSSMPSDADSMGANTCRWTHKGIANVPRITSEYGEAIRSCFTAREGTVWVGWDASSLEACVEAHYTYPYDDGKYAKELMEGDVHTKNQKALGLPDRTTAKTFKYAITYGAQPPTLAKTLGGTTAEAQEVFDAFWKANPALSKLKRDLEKEWEINGKKYINGLDGRKIWTRSKHSLLNALFQSAGAVIMKYSMIIADHWIKKTELQAVGLIRYHDEEIWECDPDDAPKVLALGVRSIQQSGETLKLNIPLGAEGKIGKNWAEVH